MKSNQTVKFARQRTKRAWRMHINYNGKHCVVVFQFTKVPTVKWYGETVLNAYFVRSGVITNVSKH